MTTSATAPRWQRALSAIRPSHRHSPFSAAMLLMIAAVVSRMAALLRVKYVAWILGRGPAADAFNAAFQLPDMLLYFLVGGAATIAFLTILTEYYESGREEEGKRLLSIILTNMLLVLGAATVIAEFAAPWYVRWWFGGFSPQEVALCVQLTRIMLPMDVCLFSGAIFSAVLLVHRVFSAQAISLIVYNLCIVLGGLLLTRFVGASSLAYGALTGAILGMLLPNLIGAYYFGVRYRPSLGWSNPGLRRWIGMSIPLMLGVSLVNADTWIINYFASHVGGAVTLLAYAKQMFSAPLAIGQAAGAASLPFLASLYIQADLKLFSLKVNSSISQLISFSLLVSSFMIAMALPLIDLLFRGGAFQRDDASIMADYFAIFCVSIFLWSAQAIYVRAFYAANMTVTPMVASTIITIVSVPLYWLLYKAMGPLGLPIASNLGILLQTATLAVLLHRRRMVLLGSLEYGEIGRSLLASIAAFAPLAGLAYFFHSSNRWAELALLIVGTIVWFAVSAVVLRLIGSSLPNRFMERFAARS